MLLDPKLRKELASRFETIELRAGKAAELAAAKFKIIQERAATAKKAALDGAFAEHGAEAGAVIADAEAIRGEACGMCYSNADAEAIRGEAQGLADLARDLRFEDCEDDEEDAQPPMAYAR